MNIENEIEIWKVIDGYENYEVSNFGNVKALNYRCSGKERLLKQQKCTNGYLMVRVYKNCEWKIFRVHVLVAMEFHGHKPDGTTKICVDHIDNNKLNNHVDNLQLISHRENSSKDKKDGTSKYIGVHWNKGKNKWTASITFNWRLIHLGHFDLEIDAANAYQKAKKEEDEGFDLNILYPKKTQTSQYKGVCWDKRAGKWLARYNGKHIGLFNTEIEAHEAREKYIANINLIV